MRRLSAIVDASFGTLSIDMFGDGLSGISNQISERVNDLSLTSRVHSRVEAESTMDGMGAAHAGDGHSAAGIMSSPSRRMRSVRAPDQRRAVAEVPPSASPREMFHASGRIVTRLALLVGEYHERDLAGSGRVKFASGRDLDVAIARGRTVYVARVMSDSRRVIRHTSVGRFGYLLM